MLCRKSLLAVCCLCTLAMVWGTAGGQPTLPKDSIPEGLRVEVRRSLELLYSEDPKQRVSGLRELGRLKPEQLEPVLPFLLSMMADKGEAEQWLVYPSPDIIVIRVEDSLAAALARVGEPAREPLIKALDDERVEVRRCAVQALGYLKGPRAAQSLAALAGDADSSVRKAVAWALWSVADPETAETLARLLADEDQAIRKAASEALMRLGEPGIERLVRAAAAQGPGVVEALQVLVSAREPRAVAPLIASLKSSRVELRLLAAEHLGNFQGTEVAKALAAMLEDDQGQVRIVAARSLGAVRDASAVDGLVAALKDKEPKVRTQAAAALGRIGDRRALDALIAAAGDEDPRVGEAAVWALGALRDPGAVEPLIRALRSGQPLVRARAAEILGTTNDARAVEPLVEALSDEDRQVRACAARGLGTMGDPRTVEPLIKALDDDEEWVRVSAVEALGRIDDPRVVEPLAKALSDEDKEVRARAARTLGKIKDSRAVVPLIGALADDEQDVQDEAIRALGEIGDPRAVQPIIGVLVKMNDEYAAKAASERSVLREIPDVGEHMTSEMRHLELMIGVLGRLGDPRAVRPLLKVLDYADYGHCIHAALKDMSIDSEIDAIVSILSTGRYNARVCAVRLLANTHDPRAIAGLIAVLGDRDLGDVAADSLTEIGQPAVGPLIQALKEGSIEARRRAARILGSLRSSEAIPALISALRDKDDILRNEAGRALVTTAAEKHGLKGDFGFDPDKWQAWWEAQRQTLQREDDPPQD